VLRAARRRHSRERSALTPFATRLLYISATQAAQLLRRLTVVMAGSRHGLLVAAHLLFFLFCRRGAAAGEWVDGWAGAGQGEEWEDDWWLSPQIVAVPVITLGWMLATVTRINSPTPGSSPNKASAFTVGRPLWARRKRRRRLVVRAGLRRRCAGRNLLRIKNEYQGRRLWFQNEKHCVRCLNGRRGDSAVPTTGLKSPPRSTCFLWLDYYSS